MSAEDSTSVGQHSETTEVGKQGAASPAPRGGRPASKRRSPVMSLGAAVAAVTLAGAPNPAIAAPAPGKQSYDSHIAVPMFALATSGESLLPSTHYSHSSHSSHISHYSGLHNSHASHLSHTSHFSGSHSSHFSSSPSGSGQGGSGGASAPPATPRQSHPHPSPTATTLPSESTVPTVTTSVPVTPVPVISQTPTSSSSSDDGNPVIGGIVLIALIGGGYALVRRWRAHR